MYIIQFKTPDIDEPITWTTEVRALARATEKLAKDNGWEAQTSVEVPETRRVIKFKGVD